MKANNTLFNYLSTRKTRASNLQKEGLSAAKPTLRSNKKRSESKEATKPEELLA